MAESTKNIGRVIMLYKGEYSPKTTYAKLDVVYQDSTKSSYISLQDNNIGKEPKDNPTFWGIISKAKYDVNNQDIKDAVANVIATSDFKVGNMDIVTANPRIDFHFNSSDKPTSSIKEFSSGTLQVPGSLVVLGDLIANANSAMALDHPLKINGQDIQTAVNNNSKLTADVQVNTLKASTDLSDLSVYPSLNATYGLSGKYVASPNDATSYTAILQVSSYPDASHVRLVFIDTGSLGTIYTRTYTSGSWSTWQKVVIDSDTIAKASTAGKLAKAVSINGTAFDGSSDIAVNAANDSTLVHKSGNESIAGNKTFTGTVSFKSPLDITSVRHDLTASNIIKLPNGASVYCWRIGNTVEVCILSESGVKSDWPAFTNYKNILPVGYRPIIINSVPVITNSGVLSNVDFLTSGTMQNREKLLPKADHYRVNVTYTTSDPMPTD